MEPAFVYCTYNPAAEPVAPSHRVAYRAADAAPEEGRRILQTLNEDPMVHGILLQLPLPDGLPADTIRKLAEILAKATEELSPSPDQPQ